ncbi:MAG: thioredoxin-disulfide reductase [Syntrophales bacterium]|nr:thioredoxin-disulfide reductase [Syntrophales bacterium]
MVQELYDVIVVGGGPAGFTAGLYVARDGLKVLLVEGETNASQAALSDFIENYPGIVGGISGFDLVELFRRQALSFGLETVKKDVVSIRKLPYSPSLLWEVITRDSAYRAIAVIVATGASWRKLNIPGEEEFTGRGVSYCATCDGPLYRDQRVVVVGGGDSAIQEAIFLARFASHVTVVHRRDRLRASKVLQERAFSNPKISFMWNSQVIEIKGRQSVEAVIVKNTELQQLDELEAQGVFVFVGLVPNVDVVKDLVELSENGAIKVDREMRTSATGIFACGDCIEKSLRQVVTACGDGAVAAHSARLYVEDYRGVTYG